MFGPPHPEGLALRCPQQTLHCIPITPGAPAAATAPQTSYPDHRGLPTPPTRCMRPQRRIHRRQRQRPQRLPGPTRPDRVRIPRASKSFAIERMLWPWISRRYNSTTTSASPGSGSCATGLGLVDQTPADTHTAPDHAGVPARHWPQPPADSVRRSSRTRTRYRPRLAAGSGGPGHYPGHNTGHAW
jgi:hypothetical protein